MIDIIANNCLRCHKPGQQQGGLDLSNLAILDKSYEAKILNRITTADVKLRMPKGGSLTAEEIAAFFRVSSICGGDKP